MFVLQPKYDTRPKSPDACPVPGELLPRDWPRKVAGSEILSLDDSDVSGPSSFRTVHRDLLHITDGPPPREIELLETSLTARH